jgi:hypothetical protein
MRHLQTKHEARVKRHILSGCCLPGCRAAQGGSTREHWTEQGPEFLRHLLESETYEFNQKDSRWASAARKQKDSRYKLRYISYEWAANRVPLGLPCCHVPLSRPEKRP